MANVPPDSPEAQMEDDVRLDEQQRSIMNRMIAEGIDEREAKLRVLCIAKPPDHFQVVPNPNLAYPRMVYHVDGRTRLAKDKQDHEAALDAGWENVPTPAALEILQTGVKPAVEATIPASMSLAVEKQRKVAARNSK